MVIAAPAAETSGAVSTTPVVEPAEQIQILAPHELRKAAGDALRRQAIEKNEKQHVAVRDLVVVYKQLQADKQMATGDRERLHTKVRNRLMKFSRETSAAIAKRKAIQRARERRANRGRKAKPLQPVTVGLSDRALHILAQQMGGLAGGMGGPGGVGGGAQGGLEDDGEELVELIQTVISPDHWDVNGGPGSIVYYGGLHVLIVRASGEVHGDLGGVLDKLREIAP
jgi:hypothetical protein